MEDKYRFFPLDAFLEKQEDCPIRYLEEYYAELELRALAHMKDANDPFTSLTIDALAKIITGQREDTARFNAVLILDKYKDMFLYEPETKGTEKLKNNPWYRRGKSGKKLRY